MINEIAHEIVMKLRQRGIREATYHPAIKNLPMVNVGTEDIEIDRISTIRLVEYTFDSWIEGGDLVMEIFPGLREPLLNATGEIHVPLSDPAFIERAADIICKLVNLPDYMSTQI